MSKLLKVLPFILGLFYILGVTLSVLGIFNILSAFGIVNILPSALYGPMEVDGDITTGWISLSIGIFLILSAMVITKKFIKD